MSVVESMLGIRRVRRPETADTPAFDLAYVRTGPPSATPIVIIPGGPGLASVLPYRGLRRIAARRDLDLIMVEHRGIGFSRADLHGAALPVDAMWVQQVIDDIAAVLDAEGAAQAWIVGSSYGSYLASSFAVAHPERVAGMVLDSALQSSTDIVDERARIRSLFWDGGDETSALVRGLRDGGMDETVLLNVVRAAYEFGGDALLLPLLRQRAEGGSATWAALQAYAARDDSIARAPGFYEFDLAGAIGFRELNYAADPDGLPLDPALTYAPLAAKFPAFVGDTFDLHDAITRMPWPIVVVAGSRDVRTPPSVAERVATAAPNGILVSIENGHSALDTHPMALLNVIRELTLGREARLPQLGATLSALPLRGLTARVQGLLGTALTLERTVAGR